MLGLWGGCVVDQWAKCRHLFGAVAVSVWSISSVVGVVGISIMVLLSVVIVVVATVHL